VGILLVTWLIYIGTPKEVEVVESEGLAINYGFSEVGTGDDQPNVPTSPGPQTITSYDRPAEGSSDAQSATSPTNGDAAKVATQDFQEAPVVGSGAGSSSSSDGKSSTQTQPKQTVSQGFKGFGAPGGNRPGNTGNEGTGGGVGDQGAPNGDPNSQNRTGNGGRGSSGIGFSLANRTSVRKPSFEDNNGVQGTVKIKIYVNRQGKVEKAEIVNLGTTIAKPSVRESCRQAAMQYQFNVSDASPELQSGFVTFNLEVQ